MLTSAPEALKLHEKIVKESWKTAMKGAEAADYLRNLLTTDGIEVEAKVSKKKPSKGLSVSSI